MHDLWGVWLHLLAVLCPPGHCVYISVYLVCVSMCVCVCVCVCVAGVVVVVGCVWVCECVCVCVCICGCLHVHTNSCMHNSECVHVMFTCIHVRWNLNTSLQAMTSLCNCVHMCVCECVCVCVCV